MKEVKGKRINYQKKVVTLILFIIAGFCFLLRFFIHDEDFDMVLAIVGTATFAGAFIGRLFKGSFGYKPTLEEIEEKQFEDKKK